VGAKVLDWVARGAVSPVKDQSSCGSCWAFSTVAAIESAYLQKKKRLLDLSEQQLVDCVYNRDGCDGGWMDTAYDYIRYFNRGIELESEYPYTATYTPRLCPQTGSIKIRGYVDSQDTSCKELRRWVKRGPVSVALSANNWGAYRSGVFTACGTSVNHAVLLVGWDSNRNWRIKNSWGTGWGDNGFMTIS
jgi:KDEL-tailed cysteine endopeptidase